VKYLNLSQNNKTSMDQNEAADILAGVLKQRVSPKDVTVQDAVVFKIDGIDAIIFADGTMWQFQGRLLPRDATAESDNRSFCFK
jgi:hypothetical protein